MEPLWKQRLVHLEARGIRLLTQHAPHYPDRFHELSHPPKLLFYRGSFRHLHRPTVSIIGSRKPTVLAARIAFATAANLVRAGMCVISGMARGIDTHALRGAYIDQSLFAAVAVLGTPISHCYPQENFGLYSTLCTRGLVMSEYPPWFHTEPYHFIYRNELIAALGDVLIVVEAGKKSGTFHTVAAALDLGRPVITFDLPAEGNQQLIEDGAHVIQKVEDVFPLIFETLKTSGIPGVRDPHVAEKRAPD